MKLPFLLAAALAGSAALPAQSAKTVEPADIADIHQLSDPQLAPDGSRVAYVLDAPDTAPHAAAPRQQHIWLATLPSSGAPRLLAASAGSDSAPRWSPDGKLLAFLSTRAGNPTLAAPTTLSNVEGHADLKPSDDDTAPEPQLWLLPFAAGGEATQLTRLAGAIKNPQWSPDGRFIAFVRRDTDTPAERDDKQKLKKDQSEIDTHYKFDRLWIYDLARHEARLVTRQDINIADYSWSPDGTLFLVRVSPTPRTDDYWRVSKIQLVSASSGAVTRTLEEHAGYATPRWSSDGVHVSYSRMRPRNITDEHVVLDLKSGSVLLLESLTPGTVEQMTWTPDGSALFAEVIVGAHTEALRLDLASGKASVVETIKGLAAFEASFTFSADGKTVTYIAGSLHHANDVWALRDGSALQVTDANPQTATWKLGEQREISWTNPKDGRKVYGVLVLPPSYVQGKAYPTVVHVHGGPEEAWTTGWHGSWYDYAALLSSHGYAVLLADPRGSDGQGPAFTEANYQDWGGGDFADIQAGLDSLIHQGIADEKELFVGGWSYGGFMTAWTATHSTRFRAAMVGAGVTDLYSMATTTDIAPSFEDGYFGSYASSRALLDAHSPVRFLDQCHTPVLVLHGAADIRVPLGQGQEFYYGLRFLGREAKMVTYPRELHIFEEREHQIDSLTRILDWYDSHR